MIRYLTFWIIGARYMIIYYIWLYNFLMLHTTLHYNINHEYYKNIKKYYRQIGKKYISKKTYFTDTL